MELYVRDEAAAVALLSSPRCAGIRNSSDGDSEGSEPERAIRPSTFISLERADSTAHLAERSPPRKGIDRSSEGGGFAFSSLSQVPFSLRVSKKKSSIFFLEKVSFARSTIRRYLQAYHVFVYFLKYK